MAFRLMSVNTVQKLRTHFHMVIRLSMESDLVCNHMGLSDYQIVVVRFVNRLVLISD